MTLVQEFTAARKRLFLAEPVPTLLPKQLTVACALVLPVAGATLSLFNTAGMAFPIGVSDRDAATVESLQFTTAQGPCHEAWSTQHPVVADQMTIASRWPLFYDGLIASSPFRAVVAVPLRHGLGHLGTLNFLLHTDSGCSHLNLSDVDAVNDSISQALLESLVPSTLTTTQVSIPDIDEDDSYRRWAAELGPTWLCGPNTARRSAVFIAVGMLCDKLDVNDRDALALLRARAFTTGRTVDDIATDVAALTLDAHDLDPDPGDDH